MSMVTVFLALLLGFAIQLPGQANRPQAPGVKRIENLLSQAGLGAKRNAHLPEVPHSIEARIRWRPYTNAQTHVLPGTGQVTPGGGFVVNRVRQLPIPIPVMRSPELSPDLLLVAGVDSAQRLIAWSLVSDPRILRAEQQARTGEVKARVLHRTTTELLVVMPDDPEIAELRFYEPRWLRSDYSLHLLGAAPLRRLGR